MRVRRAGAVRSRAGVGQPPPKVTPGSPRARVVRLRPRLRVVSRTGALPLPGGGIVVALQTRRVSRDVPKSPGVWFIVTVTAMLAFVVVWRFLH
jgi:hypothetical protein